jgi:flagellar protein FliS
MSAQSALRAYSKVDLSSEVERRSPEQLISLLFEKASSRLLQSSLALEKEDQTTFHEASTHAMQVVLGLRGVLDMEQGGAVAQQLFDTYSVIAQAIFKTKISKDRHEIEKLYEAVNELRDGWESLQNQTG